MFIAWLSGKKISCHVKFPLFFWALNDLTPTNAPSTNLVLGFLDGMKPNSTLGWGSRFIILRFSHTPWPSMVSFCSPPTPSLPTPYLLLFHALLSLPFFPHSQFFLFFFGTFFIYSFFGFPSCFLFYFYFLFCVLLLEAIVILLFFSFFIFYCVFIWGFVASLFCLVLNLFCACVCFEFCVCGALEEEDRSSNKGRSETKKQNNMKSN